LLTVLVIFSGFIIILYFGLFIFFYYAALLPRRGRILRCTLSVRLSVCLFVCPSVPLSSVTSRHLVNYNDTHVLFGRGPHIVRPSRPHKFLLYYSLYVCATIWCNKNNNNYTFTAE